MNQPAVCRIAPIAFVLVLPNFLFFRAFAFIESGCYARPTSAVICAVKPVSCNLIRNHEGVPQPRNPFFFRVIDYPVVQAHADSPTWYLSHDVYGNWNIYGCPCLDADCEEEGFDLQVAYVFAPLARLNPHECNEILLQDPDEKMRLGICAVDIVNAWSELKQIDFPSDAAFREWIRDVPGCADTIIETPGDADSIKSFVTCSYNYWSNERTIVYVF